VRVVLDTNVIVSGLNFPGNERLVLELALRGRFELYISDFILDEVAGVLVRKFDWAEERSSQALSVLRNAASIIDPQPHPDVVQPGHPDNRVLECVVAANAQYLVTGDRKHLIPLEEHHGASILNAPRFLSALEHTSPGES